MFERAIITLFKRLPDSILLKLAGGKPTVIDGRTLDPMLQILWRQGNKLKPMYELTVPEAREAMHKTVALVDMPPRPMERVVNQSIPSPAGEIPCRIYFPAERGPNPPILLWFHQGGYVIGGLDPSQSFCTLLADTAKCIVIAVQYRLAPEHKFPAPVDDAIAAYEWTIQHGADLGGDPTRVAVGGDSAGGQLSAVITHAMKKKAGQQPALQLLVYPWLVAVADTPSYTSCADAWPLNTTLMAWFIQHYTDDPRQRDDTRLSPLHETDFSGLAPALIYTAGFDPLRDEAKDYADKLKQANTPVTYRCYDSLTHSFTTMSGAVKAARHACEEIANDLKQALS